MYVAYYGDFIEAEEVVDGLVHIGKMLITFNTQIPPIACIYISNPPPLLFLRVMHTCTYYVNKGVF